MTTFKKFTLFLFAIVFVSAIFNFGEIKAGAVRITDSQIESAITWSQSKIGTKEYNFLCLGFVQDAYKQAGIDSARYRCAADAAQVWCSHPGDRNPPRGALVFWDWVGTIGGTTRNWGHVGISLGNNKVIFARSNGIQITSIDIDSSHPYKGWGVIGNNSIKIKQVTATNSQKNQNIISQNNQEILSTILVAGIAAVLLCLALFVGIRKRKSFN